MAKLVILLIRGYQYTVSPLIPPSCRFYPSCSSYALQALRARGLLSGLWLIGLRILKCHPFHPGGYDPPPQSARGALPLRTRSVA